MSLSDCIERIRRADEIRQTYYTKERREKLKMAREAKGWSISELSRRTGLPGGEIEQIENGFPIQDATHWDRLRRELGITEL